MAHSGAMIALVVPDPENYALSNGDPDATPADELHITLGYLGEAAEISPEQREAILDACQVLADTSDAPEALFPASTGVFPPDPESTDEIPMAPFYAAPSNSERFNSLREDLMVHLASRGVGDLVSTKHPVFNPHVTLTYKPLDTPPDLSHLPTPLPTTFNTLLVKFADEKYTFPLGSEADGPELSLTASVQREIQQISLETKQSEDYLTALYLRQRQVRATPAQTRSQAALNRVRELNDPTFKASSFDRVRTLADRIPLEADPAGRVLIANRALALAARTPQPASPNEARELASLTASLRAIIADGNSSAARSMRARQQLRDRYGRWIEMGGGVRFKVRKPGTPGGGTWYHGTVAGFDIPNGRVIVELEDGRKVAIPNTKLEQPKAILGMKPVANAKKFVAKALGRKGKATQEGDFDPDKAAANDAADAEALDAIASIRTDVSPGAVDAKGKSVVPTGGNITKFVSENRDAINAAVAGKKQSVAMAGSQNPLKKTFEVDTADAKAVLDALERREASFLPTQEDLDAMPEDERAKAIQNAQVKASTNLGGLFNDRFDEDAKALRKAPAVEEADLEEVENTESVTGPEATTEETVAATSESYDELAALVPDDHPLAAARERIRAALGTANERYISGDDTKEAYLKNLDSIKEFANDQEPSFKPSYAKQNPVEEAFGAFAEDIDNIHAALGGQDEIDEARSALWTANSLVENNEDLFSAVTQAQEGIKSGKYVNDNAAFAKDLRAIADGIDAQDWEDGEAADEAAAELRSAADKVDSPVAAAPEVPNSRQEQWSTRSTREDTPPPAKEPIGPQIEGEITPQDILDLDLPNTDGDDYHDTGFEPVNEHFKKGVVLPDGSEVRFRYIEDKDDASVGYLSGELIVRRDGKDTSFKFDHTPYGIGQGRDTKDKAFQKAADFINGVESKPEPEKPQEVPNTRNTREQPTGNEPIEDENFEFPPGVDEEGGEDSGEEDPALEESPVEDYTEESEYADNASDLAGAFTDLFTDPESGEIYTTNDAGEKAWVDFDEALVAYMEGDESKVAEVGAHGRALIDAITTDDQFDQDKLAAFQKALDEFAPESEEEDGPKEAAPSLNNFNETYAEFEDVVNNMEDGTPWKSNAATAGNSVANIGKELEQGKLQPKEAADLLDEVAADFETLDVEDPAFDGEPHGYDIEAAKESVQKLAKGLRDSGYETGSKETVQEEDSSTEDSSSVPPQTETATDEPADEGDEQDAAEASPEEALGDGVAPTEEPEEEKAPGWTGTDSMTPTQKAAYDQAAEEMDFEFESNLKMLYDEPDYESGQGAGFFAPEKAQADYGKFVDAVKSARQQFEAPGSKLSPTDYRGLLQQAAKEFENSPGYSEILGFDNEDSDGEFEQRFDPNDVVDRLTENLPEPRTPFSPFRPILTGPIGSDPNAPKDWTELKDYVAGKTMFVLDFETTGLDVNSTDPTDLPTEIGIAKVVDGKVVETFQTFVNPGKPISPEASKITNITDDMVAGAPDPASAYAQLMDFVGEDDGTHLWASHNATFDEAVLSKMAEAAGQNLPERNVLDTLALARNAVPTEKKGGKEGLESHKLGDLAEAFGVTVEGDAHRADVDAATTANVLNAMLDFGIENNSKTGALKYLNDNNSKYPAQYAEWQQKLDKFKDGDYTPLEAAPEAPKTQDQVVPAQIGKMWTESNIDLTRFMPAIDKGLEAYRQAGAESDPNLVDTNFPEASALRDELNKVIEQFSQKRDGDSLLDTIDAANRYSALFENKKDSNPDKDAVAEVEGSAADELAETLESVADESGLDDTSDLDGPIPTENVQQMLNALDNADNPTAAFVKDFMQKKLDNGEQLTETDISAINELFQQMLDSDTSNEVEKADLNTTKDALDPEQPPAVPEPPAAGGGDDGGDGEEPPTTVEPGPEPEPEPTGKPVKATQPDTIQSEEDHAKSLEEWKAAHQQYLAQHEADLADPEIKKVGGAPHHPLSESQDKNLQDAIDKLSPKLRDALQQKLDAHRAAEISDDDLIQAISNATMEAPSKKLKGILSGAQAGVQANKYSDVDVISPNADLYGNDGDDIKFASPEVVKNQLDAILKQHQDGKDLAFLDKSANEDDKAVRNHIETAEAAVADALAAFNAGDVDTMTQKMREALENYDAARDLRDKVHKQDHLRRRIQARRRAVDELLGAFENRFPDPINGGTVQKYDGPFRTEGHDYVELDNGDRIYPGDSFERNWKDKDAQKGIYLGFRNNIANGIPYIKHKLDQAEKASTEGISSKEITRTAVGPNNPLYHDPSYTGPRVDTTEEVIKWNQTVSPKKYKAKNPVSYDPATGTHAGKPVTEVPTTEGDPADIFGGEGPGPSPEEMGDLTPEQFDQYENAWEIVNNLSEESTPEWSIASEYFYDAIDAEVRRLAKEGNSPEEIANKVIGTPSSVFAAKNFNDFLKAAQQVDEFDVETVRKMADDAKADGSITPEQHKQLNDTLNNDWFQDEPAPAPGKKEPLADWEKELLGVPSATGQPVGTKIKLGSGEEFEKTADNEWTAQHESNAGATYDDGEIDEVLDTDSVVTPPTEDDDLPAVPPQSIPTPAGDEYVAKVKAATTEAELTKIADQAWKDYEDNKITGKDYNNVADALNEKDLEFNPVTSPTSAVGLLDSIDTAQSDDDLDQILDKAMESYKNGNINAAEFSEILKSIENARDALKPAEEPNANSLDPSDPDLIDKLKALPIGSKIKVDSEYQGYEGVWTKDDDGWFHENGDGVVTKHFADPESINNITVLGDENPDDDGTDPDGGGDGGTEPPSTPPTDPAPGGAEEEEPEVVAPSTLASGVTDAGGFKVGEAVEYYDYAGNKVVGKIESFVIVPNKYDHSYAVLVNEEEGTKTNYLLTALTAPGAENSPFQVASPMQKGKDGDIWVKVNGRKKWGRYGAAGIAVIAEDENGEMRVLMGKRGDRDEWYLPGGAIDQHETPIQGATREFTEEANEGPGLVSKLELVSEHTKSAGVIDGTEDEEWNYTTIVAKAPGVYDVTVPDGIPEYELGEYRWLTASELKEMDLSGQLHPAMQNGEFAKLIGFDGAVPDPDAEGLDLDAAGDPPDLSTPYYDISEWKYEGGSSGSQVGGIYTDPDGNKYLVKSPSNAEVVHNEVLTSSIYDALGIKTGTARMGVDVDGKPVIVSPWVDGSDPKGLLKAIQSGDQDFINKVREDFAIDAWLGNYDVAGLNFDNIIADAEGNPVRIDQGSGLLFRATGGKKSWWGSDPVEFDGMRFGSNKSSAFGSAKQVFGGMTDEQIIQSLDKLGNISPEQIKKMVAASGFSQADKDDLAETLIKRRHKMLEQYGLLDKYSTKQDSALSTLEQLKSQKKGKGEFDKGQIVHVNGLEGDYVVTAKHESGMYFVQPKDGGPEVSYSGSYLKQIEDAEDGSVLAFAHGGEDFLEGQTAYFLNPVTGKWSKGTVQGFDDGYALLVDVEGSINEWSVKPENVVTEAQYSQIPSSPQPFAVPTATPVTLGSGYATVPEGATVLKKQEKPWGTNVLVKHADGSFWIYNEKGDAAAGYGKSADSYKAEKGWVDYNLGTQAVAPAADTSTPAVDTNQLPEGYVPLSDGAKIIGVQTDVGFSGTLENPAYLVKNADGSLELHYHESNAPIGSGQLYKVPSQYNENSYLMGDNWKAVDGYQGVLEPPKPATEIVEPNIQPPGTFDGPLDKAGNPISKGDIVTTVAYGHNGKAQQGKVVSILADGRIRIRRMDADGNLLSKPNGAPDYATLKPTNVVNTKVPDSPQGASVAPVQPPANGDLPAGLTFNTPDTSSPWYGKPKPQAPVQSSIAQGDLVDADWVARADAAYQARKSAKGSAVKPVAQSAYWDQYYKKAMQGDQASLDYLRDNGYFQSDPTLYDDAQKQIDINKAKVAEAVAAYQAEFDKYSADMAEWAKAQGQATYQPLHPSQVKGLSKSAAHNFLKNVYQSKISNLSSKARSALQSQKGSSGWQKKLRTLSKLVGLKREDIAPHATADQMAIWDGIKEAADQMGPVGEPWKAIRVVSMSRFADAMGVNFTDSQTGGVNQDLTKIIGTIQKDHGGAEFTPGGLDEGGMPGFAGGWNGETYDVIVDLTVPGEVKGTYTGVGSFSNGGENGFIAEPGMGMYIWDVVKLNGQAAGTAVSGGYYKWKVVATVIPQEVMPYLDYLRGKPDAQPIVVPEEIKKLAYKYIPNGLIEGGTYQ